MMTQEYLRKQEMFSKMISYEFFTEYFFATKDELSARIKFKSKWSLNGNDFQSHTP